MTQGLVYDRKRGEWRAPKLNRRNARPSVTAPTFELPRFKAAQAEGDMTPRFASMAKNRPDKYCAGRNVPRIMESE